MKKIVVAVALLGLSAALAPARADWDVRLGYGDWGHPYRHHQHWGPPRAYYAPPMVVYRAPPRVIYRETYPVYDAVPMSPTFTDRFGRYCREYQGTVVVGGVPQPSYGTACLQPDGAWRIMP